MKRLAQTVLLPITIALAAIVSAHAQTGGKTMVRIYDAMPQTEAPPRLAVWIGDKKIVSDITPGETSFLTELSSSAISITVKDASGATIGGLSALTARSGALINAILTENGKKVAVIPVAVDSGTIKNAITATTSVFIPANLSPDIEYTFELQTRDEPPKTTSVTIKPLESAQFPLDLDKIDWKVTGKRGDKTFTIPATRFPPLELLKSRAAILMLPRAGDSAEIVALNALDNGFILKDR